MNSVKLNLMGGIVLILTSLISCLASAGWSILVVPTPTLVAETTPTPPTRTPASATATVTTPTPTLEVITSTPASSGDDSDGDDSDSVTVEPSPSPSPSRIVSVSPTPSSTESSITGLVATDFGRLNIRRGPSVNYGLVGHLENGDRVEILRRTPAGDWLEIESQTHKIGWVSEKYIEIQGKIRDISVATNLEPTPPPPQTNTAPDLSPLDPYRGDYTGTLAPYEERWYTFSEGEQPGAILLVLMFKPNVNLKGEGFSFFLHDREQIPDWPPKDPDRVINVGSGSRPASDRDGDLGNGELIWRGGPLQRNMQYYLRLVNRSTSTVQYCLATQEVYEWTCQE